MLLPVLSAQDAPVRNRRLPHLRQRIPAVAFALAARTLLRLALQAQGLGFGEVDAVRSGLLPCQSLDPNVALLHTGLHVSGAVQTPGFLPEGHCLFRLVSVCFEKRITSDGVG